MAFPSWIIDSDAWLTDVIYLLTDELRFVDCNPVWDSFAAANRGKAIADLVPSEGQTARYLELALRNGGPIATLDDDLRRAANKAGVKIFKPT